MKLKQLSSRFTRSEDSSPFAAPEEVYSWRLWFMMLSAACAAGAFGYDGAFIGGTLKLESFKNEFGLTDSEAAERLAELSSNIVSTFQAGCFFGTLLTFPLVERIGMRPCLIISSIVFCIGAILQLAANGHIGLIYAGRALTGLGVGNGYMVAPAYVSVNSPATVRGKMVGLLETVYQGFSVIGFWINYGVNEHISGTTSAQWKIPVGFQLLPGALLGILMTFQPEAPRWLMQKEKRRQAKESLSYLRNLPLDHPYVAFELQQIEDQLEEEKRLGSHESFFKKCKEMLGPYNRYRLMLGIGLMLFQNLSGINALNYYSATLISNIGFKGTSVSLLTTGAYGLLKATGTLIYMLFFVDTWGRRKALLFSSMGAASGMLYLFGYTFQARTFVQQPPRDAGAIFGLVAFYWFTLHYSYGWNGIPFMYCSEIFPGQIRMLCITITTASQWLFQFMIVYSLPYMVLNIKSFTFFFFGISTVFAGIFTWFFVPETKGILLEDMDLLFSNHVFARKQKRLFDQAVANRSATIAVSSGVNVVQQQQDDESHSKETNSRGSDTKAEESKDGKDGKVGADRSYDQNALA